mgnify:CR=1 FL=1
MIQDIAPHTYHNEYKPVAPDKESHILAYEEGKILMKKDGGDYDSSKLLEELEGKVENLYENYIYLFSIDEEHFYLIPDLDTSLLPGYQFEITRVLRTAEPQYLAFAGITGYQLFQWYSKRVSAAAAANRWYMINMSAR